MSVLRYFAVLTFLVALSACGTMNAPSCPGGQQAVVQELLYFGTDMPIGRVTPEEWAQFLADTVTPSFPEGLSAWQAAGQWRSPSGAATQEPSYVLSLVHPASVSAEKAIQELIASYKTRFKQEAVLRVNFNACSSL